MKKTTLLFLITVLLTSCAYDRGRLTQEGVCGSDLDDSYLYGRFNDSRTEGPLIPGLLQDLVPQGMAVAEDRDMIVLSHYSSEGRAGALTFLSADTGLLSKVLYLANGDGSAHTGHLGGLAAGDDYLWIASGKGVYNLSYDLLDRAPHGAIISLPPLIGTETKGSFATFADGMVWVGEFTRANGDYPVPESHWRRTERGRENRAWLGAYSPGTLLASRGTVFPEKILSIPHEAQGALFSDDQLFLSRSFGRRNKSRLDAYALPPDRRPDELLGKPGGGATPLWILGEADKRDQLIMPPMSEAIALGAESIAVLFESGAAKYRGTADCPLDRIQYIPLKQIGEP